MIDTSVPSNALPPRNIYALIDFDGETIDQCALDRPTDRPQKRAKNVIMAKFDCNNKMIAQNMQAKANHKQQDRTFQLD